MFIVLASMIVVFEMFERRKEKWIKKRGEMCTHRILRSTPGGNVQRLACRPMSMSVARFAACASSAVFTCARPPTPDRRPKGAERAASKDTQGFCITE